MTGTVGHRVLLGARALIASPQRWTRRVLASTEDGRPLMWHDREAGRWCAVGAILRAAYDLVGDKDLAARIADEVIGTLPLGLSAINDGKGHNAVLAVFDRSLAAQQATNCWVPEASQSA